MKDSPTQYSKGRDACRNVVIVVRLTWYIMKFSFYIVTTVNEHSPLSPKHTKFPYQAPNMLLRVTPALLTSCGIRPNTSMSPYRKKAPVYITKNPLIFFSLVKDRLQHYFSLN